MVAAVLTATATAATSPIEGTWAWGPYPIVIKATGPGSYTGTLTKAIPVHSRFVDCTAPAGFVFMTITGTASPFNDAEKMPGGMEAQTCDEIGAVGNGHLIPGTAYGKSVLFWCSANPGQPIPALGSGPGCQTLARIGAAPAATTKATTGAATAAATYIVPAGQTKSESKPTLTGAGPYSYFAPTFDRAAKNNYPNRARLLGEVYLGDGGATATYTIKTLSRTTRRLSLWIYYSDDGLHQSGDRAVVISIPKLKQTIQWSNKSQDTKGWKAEKVGTITTSGDVTVSFRKKATTSAAFVMNAFAFTTAAQPPLFG